MDAEEPKKRTNGSNDFNSESVNGTTTKSQDGGDGDGGGEVGLKAKMSLLNGCTVIVGSIIGSGIFVSPTGVLMHTGSVNMALIVWILSGLFSMVSSFFFFLLLKLEYGRKLIKWNETRYALIVFLLKIFQFSSKIGQKGIPKQA